MIPYSWFFSPWVSSLCGFTILRKLDSLVVFLHKNLSIILLDAHVIPVSIRTIGRKWKPCVNEHNKMHREMPPLKYRPLTSVGLDRTLVRFVSLTRQCWVSRPIVGICSVVSTRLSMWINERHSRFLLAGKCIITFWKFQATWMNGMNCPVCRRPVRILVIPMR